MTYAASTAGALLLNGFTADLNNIYHLKSQKMFLQKSTDMTKNNASGKTKTFMLLERLEYLVCRRQFCVIGI